MKIAGARTLLTGASSGIGRALAFELADRGARLAISARREELLRTLGEEIARRGGERPAIVVGDLSQRGEPARVAGEALGKLGGVDVLVNNAGGGVGGMQVRVGDRDEAREAFEVNVWAPLALTAALVPQMRARRSGAVVNVTSMGQAMPVWGMGHYVATKAALALATESLRLELGDCGVHVLQVIPGPVDTAIQGESRLLPGAERLFRGAPVGDPERLARLVVRALEHERQRVVYPRLLRPIYAWPGLYRAWIARQARRIGGRDGFEDPRVIRTGSAGAPEAQRARAEWETARGR